ncbi:MAG: response regulator transcription factor [Mangrovibacterium sp.]
MDLTDKKILLAEDDQSLNFIITDQLREAGYEVTPSMDGEEAYHLFTGNTYDLCLLDIMLPKLDGFALAREIRKSDDQVPILFLTARSLQEDKLKGFSLGGDDYITKPFSMDELLLRIRVFLKRSSPETNHSSQTGNYSIGHYTFCFDDLSLIHRNGDKTLTFKEAQLLNYFCKQPNRVLSRSEILKNVWGTDDYYLGRSLDVFISRLRKYLIKDPDIRIINLHGIGFRFNAPVKRR